MSPEHPRPKGRLYLYPMGGVHGEHRFTHGTFEDMKAEKITPADGMRLKFHCDDGNDKGEPDYLLLDGTVTFKNGEWWVLTEGERFWHESDEADPPSPSN